LPWTWTPRRLTRYMKLATTNTYVAECNAQLIGFSVASIGDVRGHLVLLAVEKNWRNHGIGHTLLNWQLQAAQTAGLTDMSLEVRSGNRTAQLFYAAVGFRKVRTLSRYYCNIEDAYRLRLSPIRIRTTRWNTKGFSHPHFPE